MASRQITEFSGVVIERAAAIRERIVRQAKEAAPKPATKTPVEESEAEADAGAEGEAEADANATNAEADAEATNAEATNADAANAEATKTFSLRQCGRWPMTKSWSTKS